MDIIGGQCNTNNGCAIGLTGFFMTTKELEKRVRVARIGSGTFRFETRIYGRQIYMTTNDSVIYDVINSGEPCMGTTYRQALQRAHECVVRANKKYPIYKHIDI